jgi:hypothetical protein
VIVSGESGSDATLSWYCPAVNVPPASSTRIRYLAPGVSCGKTTVRSWPAPVATAYPIRVRAVLYTDIRPANRLCPATCSHTVAEDPAAVNEYQSASAADDRSP